MAALRAAIDEAQAMVEANIATEFYVSAAVSRSDGGSAARTGAAFRWPMVEEADGTLAFAGLEESVAEYVAKASDTYGVAQAFGADSAALAAAVVVAVARATAAATFGITPAHVASAEAGVRAKAAARREVAAEDAEAVAVALRRWAAVGHRAALLVFFNAAGATAYGKFAAKQAMPEFWASIVAGAGLEDLFAVAPWAETVVAEEMFYPVAATVLDEVATWKADKVARGGVEVRFAEEHFPTWQAPGTIALVFSAVVEHARSFGCTPYDLPAICDTPTYVRDAIAAAAAATTVQTSTAARFSIAVSARLLEPAWAYVVGYVAGKESRHNHRAVTPAIVEVTKNAPGIAAAVKLAKAAPHGMFAAGSAAGWATRSTKLAMGANYAAAAEAAVIAATVGVASADMDRAIAQARAALASEVAAYEFLARTKATVAAAAAAIAAAGAPPSTDRAPPKADPAIAPPPAPDEAEGRGAAAHA